MDIDGHPFLGVHMVEFQLAKEKTKVLTSAKDKENGSVDPKFRYQLMSTRRLSSNAISKRADMSKERPPGQMLCVLV
jgi:hypothetical protein